MEVTALIAAATSRMIIMGSAICLKNWLIREGFFAASSSFLPSRSRRPAASSALRPFSLLPTSRSTLSASSQ